MRMGAEQLQLLMDVLEVNDQQVAKKLKVSLSTIISWRTGKTDIHCLAAVAIDRIFGNGVEGSAMVKVVRNLEDEWMKFVSNLSTEELVEIAESHMAIDYDEGAFGLTGYREELGCWQIYNEASDATDRPAYYSEKIVNLIYDLVDEEEYEKELKNLVAEAERSIMFMYRSTLGEMVLQEIYANIMKNIDEEISEC